MKKILAISLAVILASCATKPVPEASVQKTPTHFGTIDQPERSVQLTPFEGQQIDPQSLQSPLIGAQALQTQSFVQNKTVVVYYSNPLPTTYSYRDGGGFYSLLLGNLVGQYGNVKVVKKPINQYSSAEAKGATRVFYIGSVFDEALPQSFVDDVKGGLPTSWIGYNIWKLGGYGGITYNSTFSDTGANVSYKNYLYKGYPASQEFSDVSLSSGVQTIETGTTSSGRNFPLLVKSGNLYYYGGNPFQYITTTSPYVAFTDTIAGMFGDTSVCQKRAFVRFEDLSPMDNPSGIRSAVDAATASKVPFSMTIIPKGYFGGKEYNWTGNGAALKEVYRAIQLGGVPIQHGFTHNYHNLTRVGAVQGEGNTGDEWEFWDRENGVALPGLTPDAATKRVNDGRSLLTNIGINPAIWTTPHYEAATSLYGSINQTYQVSLERKMFSSDGVLGGQFFPYPVMDSYGTLALPENLGNPQAGYLVDAVLEAARANQNLCNGWASFFIHPYLFVQNYTDVDKMTKASFTDMLNQIKAMGFTFVSPKGITLKTLN